MKVSIDRDACMGCGMCVSTCNQFFQMDGDRAKAVKDECKDYDDCDLEQIAENCPARAIKIKK